MKRIFICVLSFFCFSLNPLVAQKQQSKIVFSDLSKPIKCGALNAAKDSSIIFNHFSRCLLKIQGKGYITASIDSIDEVGDELVAHGQRGDLFQWARIEIDSISRGWVKIMDLNLDKFEYQLIKPSLLADDINKALDFFENNGYPFATISTTNTNFDRSRVSVRLELFSGPYITYDTLIIKGDLRVSRRFLESYLDIKIGKAYNENYLRQIDSKLSKLPFISLIKPSEVEFIPGKVRVYSYLTNRKASRFSGLAGFSSGDGKGLKFTGNLNLRLQNSLRNAETLNLNWYGTGEGKQSLKVDLSWPYVSGSNMVVDASFGLYKRDSTYLNLTPNFSIGFFTPRGEKIGVGFKHKSSTSLADNSLDVSNYSTNMVNILYGYSNYVSQVYPSKGIEISSSLGVGRRRHSPMGSTQTVTTNSYEFGLNGNLFFPLFWEMFIFKLGLNAETQLNFKNGSSSGILLNEMYRVGGINSLRGFEDESILATGYTVAEIELHLKASNSFSFYLFYDKAYASAYINNGITPSWPSGIGTGFILQSSSGILNLAYAMGHGFGQTMGIQNAKLHIGFTANF